MTEKDRKRFGRLQGRTVRAINARNDRFYAVMVALTEIEGRLHVVFEERSGSLKRQPGEICFPGGARDPGETSEENAVRETSEELLVAPEQIHVLAQMDTMFTSYDNKISVYLCELENYKGTFSRKEVASVFTVPLDYFLTASPDTYTNRVIIRPPEDFPYDLVPGGRDYPWHEGRANVYFYEYEGHVIWGLTAYIMQSVVKILKEEAGFAGRE